MGEHNFSRILIGEDDITSVIHLDFMPYLSVKGKAVFRYVQSDEQVKGISTIRGECISKTGSEQLFTVAGDLLREMKQIKGGSSYSWLEMLDFDLMKSMMFLTRVDLQRADKNMLEGILMHVGVDPVAYVKTIKDEQLTQYLKAKGRM